MNLFPAWKPTLEASEIEVAYWSDIGDPGVEDEELIK